MAKLRQFRPFELRGKALVGDWHSQKRQLLQVGSSASVQLQLMKAGRPWRWTEELRRR